MVTMSMMAPGPPRALTTPSLQQHAADHHRFWLTFQMEVQHSQHLVRVRIHFRFRDTASMQHSLPLGRQPLEAAGCAGIHLYVHVVLEVEGRRDEGRHAVVAP